MTTKSSFPRLAMLVIAFSAFAGLLPLLVRAQTPADTPPGRYLLRVEAQARGNLKDGPAAAETVITVR
jgi:hypothetical protein